ncbi:MAG TPA: hypothetical protein O0W79_05165 [Methanocorpusculum sp.]|nr:hypothetical protein [Methanocorpusculum sp.]
MNQLPIVGTSVDLLELRDLRRELHINVYLYMDAEIAASSTVKDDIAKYRLVDFDYRPVLEIEEWIKNMQKQMKQISGSSANIEQMLSEQPLYAEILEIGEIETPVGSRKYLKCLLPFLDEMEEMEVHQASGFK